MIPIIDKLAGLLDYKARYAEEVQENFTLTEQNIDLRKQIKALEVQLQIQAATCEQTCQEHTVERTQLIEDQIELADRISSLLEQCHNFQAKNADLEDEIARLKHKKLPSREKV